MNFSREFQRARGGRTEKYTTEMIMPEPPTCATPFIFEQAFGSSVVRLEGTIQTQMCETCLIPDSGLSGRVLGTLW